MDSSKGKHIKRCAKVEGKERRRRRSIMMKSNVVLVNLNTGTPHLYEDMETARAHMKEDGHYSIVKSARELSDKLATATLEKVFKHVTGKEGEVKQKRVFGAALWNLIVGEKPTKQKEEVVKESKKVKKTKAEKSEKAESACAMIRRIAKERKELTIDEVHEMVKKTFPKISRTTVQIQRAAGLREV